MSIKMKISKIIEKIKKNKPIMCTECGEVYEPISPHSDIRCVNCGNHQNVGM